MGFISFLISIVLIFVVCKINETCINLADKLADIQRQVHKLQKFNAEFSNEELKQSQVLSESQKVQTDESIQQKQNLNQDVVESQNVLAQNMPQATDNNDALINIIESDDVVDDKNNTKQVNSADFSFEKFFLGNLFNKIGAIALFVGLIVFIKLVSNYIVFTPVMKATLAYMATCVLFFFGFKLRKQENMENYSEVVFGTAIGTLFITTYCCATVLELFNSLTTFILATVFLICSFVLAKKFNKRSVLVLSIIAGYLNPFFINYHADFNSNFLFAYLIFINLLSLIFVYKTQKHHFVNFVNIIATSICALIWCQDTNILLVLLLWGLYSAYIFIDEKQNPILHYVNLFSLLILVISHYATNNYAIGFVALFAGFAYILFAYLKTQQRNLYIAFINCFLIVLNFAIFYLTKEYPIMAVYFWSMESIALSYFVKSDKAISRWMMGIWSLALVYSFTFENIFYYENLNDYNMVFNFRLASFAPLFLSALLNAFHLQKKEYIDFLKYSNLFRFSYISLAFLYVALEINGYFAYISNNLDAVAHAFMANCIIALLYVIRIKMLYCITKYCFFDFLSALLFVISLLVLLIGGILYNQIDYLIFIFNLRFIAFMFAIGVSFAYYKLTKFNLYQYLALILGFIAIHLEFSYLVDNYLSEQAFLISVSWIFYAGLIILIGMFKSNKPFKETGIILTLCAAARIFLFDLASLEITYKFIAFLILGASSMYISYLYNKNIK